MKTGRRTSREKPASAGSAERPAQQHYFSAQPETASAPGEIRCRFGGIDFSFITDSGVFSKNRPDYGSELLLNTFIAQRRSGLANGIRIMDLGCGYGLVGTVVKRVFPETEIVMADVNSRAAALAAENALRNNVRFADVRRSDCFDNVEGMFDVILTNPPIRAGKATVFRFYEESLERLRPGGSLYVVIQKKQGAPSSAEKLAELFGNCSVIDKSAGYRILQCIKAAADEVSGKNDPIKETKRKSKT